MTTTLDVPVDDFEILPAVYSNTPPDALFDQPGVASFNRPDKPPPPESSVSALDNGRTKPAANDNQPPVHCHLKVLADKGQLGVDRFENDCHWVAAERLKWDIARSNREPLIYFESLDWRKEMLYGAEQARQVVALAQHILGHDFRVLKAFIVDNVTAREFGEYEGCLDRVTASGYGRGMLIAALRNLVRFYEKLDRSEKLGHRLQDVWFSPAKPAPVKRVRDFRRGTVSFMNQISYMNQSRNYVVPHPASRVAA